MEFTTTSTADNANKQTNLFNEILECQKVAFDNGISFDCDIEFTSTGSKLVHVKAFYSSTDDCAISHAFNTTFDFSVTNQSNKIKLDKLTKFIDRV